MKHRLHCAISALLFCLPFQAAAEDPVMNLYMAPNGINTNSGSSPSAPVQSLLRIHQKMVAANPDGPVDVYIAPGQYLEQAVNWTYFNGYPIRFLPLDSSAPHPVFDGLGNKQTWFVLSVSAGVETLIQFRHLQVQNYLTAVSFNGNRNEVNTLLGWNGSNSLDDMRFLRIGAKFTADPDDYSTAAVRFVNSRNNVVRNSVFSEIENEAANAHSLHAVYIAHRSSNNLIEGNQFNIVSGDAVRVRDSSDYNRIFHNVYIKAGDYGYSEWYCDMSRSDCSATVDECPSFGNEFRNNDLVDGYRGAIGTFYYHQGLEVSCPRLRTSGNT